MLIPGITSDDRRVLSISLILEKYDRKIIRIRERLKLISPVR